MTEASLTAAPASAPVDLRRLDAALANLRTAERSAVDLAAAVSEARDRLAAAPDDPEARRAARLIALRTRGDAAALVEQFEALAQREWAAL